jgi:mono/diheme cytochrome c family protein
MLANKYPGLILAGLFLAGTGAVLLGQRAGASKEPQQKKMEKAPITHSNPASGREMYMDYCAACHGATGKGDGPAVEFLKTPPQDLTTMAERNNGKFPADHFAALLRFGTESRAHGTSDMPIWGPLFTKHGKDIVELRIANLRSYVESIQQK